MTILEYFISIFKEKEKEKIDISNISSDTCQKIFIELLLSLRKKDPSHKKYQKDEVNKIIEEWHYNKEWLKEVRNDEIIQSYIKEFEKHAGYYQVRDKDDIEEIITKAMNESN